MAAIDFDDWKTEVMEYLTAQGATGLTATAALNSLAANGWAVPSQMALRLFLDRQIEAGKVVRVTVPDGSYYRLATADEAGRPRTWQERFADRGGVFLDEREEANCPLEVVVWDKRTETVSYFRNRNGLHTDADGNEVGVWHEPEWCVRHVNGFLVHIDEGVTLDDAPTVRDYLDNTATWIVEANGELVANVPRG